MKEGLALQKAQTPITCDYSFCDNRVHTNGLCYDHAEEHYVDHDVEVDDE